MAQAVNSALVLLYWQVGDASGPRHSKSERAAYGEQIVPTLSRQLAVEFGQRIRRPEPAPHDSVRGGISRREIVVTLSRQLGWSHFVETILPLKDRASRVRLLRRDVPDRAVERAYAACKDRRHALRAHGAFEEAGNRWSSRNSPNSGQEDMLSPDLVFRDPVLPGFSRAEGRL